MATDLVLLLLRMNLWGALAAALVWALRPSVRRLGGVRVAYALWLLPPLAMLGAALPTILTGGPIGQAETAERAVRGWLNHTPAATILLTAWAIGMTVEAALTVRAYARFRRHARAGKAGPAVVGLVNPRMILPADFDTRFPGQAGVLVRAHERAHIERGDPRIGALALVITTLNWFNPVLHLAARAMRFDQELACDAEVLSRHPAARREYAAVLTSGLGAGAGPNFGCGWQTASARAMAQRLTAILDSPTPRRQGLAQFAIAGLCATLLAGAWIAQPPYRPERVIFMEFAVLP